MNRKFKGFTPDQQFTLLKKMGYTGSPQQDEMDNFLASAPGAAAQMGKYTQLAQQRVAGKPLSPTVRLAEGGPVLSLKDRIAKNADKVYQNKTAAANEAGAKADRIATKLSGMTEGTEEYAATQARLTKAQNQQNKLLERAGQAQTAMQAESAANERSLLSSALTDPKSLVEKAEVGDVGAQKSGTIKPNAGRVKGKPTDLTAQTAQAAGTSEAATYRPTMVSGKVQSALSGVHAAQGEVSKEVEAAQGDPEAMAQLSLQAAQMEAAQVEAVNPRQLEPGEAVSGSAVDMKAVNAATQIEAAQANPSVQATVQGQLDELMQDFEGGQTPTWAAGAMRAAQQQLAARGLGASSMAGQAVIQAAMESAIPIAMADAQTYAQFDMANLNNRQQAVMLGAQQRAEFLGQKFDQEFQSKVLNAQKISDIANMNFTAEQQVALENARLVQSANLENMNAENAKMLSDAAAMSQMELTNLNNRQQAQVVNAQNFLQMDLANLSNQQQTNMFKAQANVQALFNDQAAKNAAKQFNAASENQTNQFFAELQTSVNKFNAEQTNDVNKFTETMQEERARFNAANSLIIAQANAKWRQDTALAEFQAQTDSNMQQALATNNLTSSQLDQLWQRERDLMAFAFTGSENAADRNLSILLGDKELAMRQSELRSSEKAALGAFTARVLFGSSGGDGLLGKIF